MKKTSSEERLVADYVLGIGFHELRIHADESEVGVECL